MWLSSNACAPFVEQTLGKNVVICHDTPNFIANRMVSYIMADLIAFAVEHSDGKTKAIRSKK